MAKNSAKKVSEEISESNFITASKKMIEHVFGSWTGAQVGRVFNLLPETTDEEFLVHMTTMLLAVKTGLGVDASFEDVLGVYEVLVYDEDGLQLENPSDVEDEIEGFRATIAKVLGDEEANKVATMVAFFGV
jgi:hypothetical protein